MQPPDLAPLFNRSLFHVHLICEQRQAYSKTSISAAVVVRPASDLLCCGMLRRVHASFLKTKLSDDPGKKLTTRGLDPSWAWLDCIGQCI